MAGLVECLQDKTVSPMLQRRMREAMAYEKVLAIDTSHSPFLSAPEQFGGTRSRPSNDARIRSP
jgi:pimeloyl-ACP methyl ester carboxylesterase